MIIEDYVSIENAKLLKEKGFNEKCFAFYNPDGTLIQSGIRLNNAQVGIVKSSYSAPTQQMAMRWLREVHGIFIEVNCNCNNLKLTCTISKVEDDFGDKVYEDVGFYFQTYSYEDAVEAAIKYCLENLI